MAALAPASIPGALFLPRTTQIVRDYATLFSDVDQDIQLHPDIHSWTQDNLTGRVTMIRGRNAQYEEGYWLLFASPTDGVLFRLRWL